MTLEALSIEELLEKPVSELESITEEEMTRILAPYFQVTRPEIAGKMQPNSKKVTTFKAPKTAADWEKEEKKKAAFELARRMGINLK